MNESEDCPTVLLRISYPEGYPDKPLDIEYDDEENEGFEAEDLSELNGVLKNVVSSDFVIQFLGDFWIDDYVFIFQRWKKIKVVLWLS